MSEQAHGSIDDDSMLVKNPSCQLVRTLTIAGSTNEYHCQVGLHLRLESYLKVLQKSGY